MDVLAFLSAGKVPAELLPWNRGGKFNATKFDGHSFMFHVCLEAMHKIDMAGEGFGGYTVMEDSDRELSRHLQAVKKAHGRVLKTGLGFGCFVRMCLLKPEVEHIDVVEIDKSIIDHFGRQFSEDPRVTIHHADATKFPTDYGPWDFAWHDIYCNGNDGLQLLHQELINRFSPFAKQQGAWQQPRFAKRLAGLAA